MATFNGPGIRVLKQYDGQDGKTYVQLDTGETVSTDSEEYRDYFDQGILYGEDERGNFYPQDGAHDYLKQYQQLTQSNSFENYMKPYFDDTMTGTIAKGLGQSMDKFWEVNSSYKQSYDNEMRQKLVEQVLQNNPNTGDQGRGAYLDEITRSLPEGLGEYIMESGNPGVEPGYWADFRKGLYTTLGDQFGGGDQELMKNIQNDPNLTTYEKNTAIRQLEMGDYGGGRRALDKLGVLAPLAVPAKMVQSAYRDEYSFDDALAGKKNNAGLIEDVLTDPLTYTGIGIAKNIKNIPKAAEVAEAVNRFGNTHLEDAYKFNPFAYRTNPESYYRQITDEGYQQIEEALGFIKGADGTGPASYSKGEPYLRDGRPSFMLEANNKPSSAFTPAEDIYTGADNVALSNNPLDLLDENVNLYKRDWLQGYKKQSKPEVLQKNVGSGMTMRREAEDPSSVTVNHPTNITLDNGVTVRNNEAIRLQQYSENGQDYFNFYANMPSSPLKAGKAYKMLDEFIPVGGKIKEDGSLSWDSFRNVLKQSQQDKFNSFQEGFINMNRMSKTEGRENNLFRNQDDLDNFFKDINSQLDEFGFDRVRGAENPEKISSQFFPLKAQFPNIVLQKKYEQGGRVLPDWLL